MDSRVDWSLLTNGSPAPETTIETEDASIGSGSSLQDIQEPAAFIVVGTGFIVVAGVGTRGRRRRSRHTAPYARVVPARD